MRFLYAKLTGYIGIYNGLGLSSIEIDFTKCRNKIVVISGPNGTGKSTILNALSIIPDGNENFVPTMEASKELRIFQDGNIYDINIVHALDKHNNRATTKATISKNGLELNPNGNVSSYKEIIFSEFDLDSNYLALSKLSSDDRGLADKKPAERKKVVASISNSLETYNAINKNLNKKANIFKSYVNNLSSKIQNIGDENYLRTTLVSLSNREANIENTIETCKKEVAKCEAMLSMNNIDDETQRKFESVESNYKISSSDVIQKKNEKERFLNEVIKKYYVDQVVDCDNIDNIIMGISNDIMTNELKMSEYNTTISGLLGQTTNLQSDIVRLNAKIDKLKSEVDTTLLETITDYKAQVDSIENDLSSLQIKDINNISVEEIRYIISLLAEVVTAIDQFYELSDSNTTQFLVSHNFSSSSINKQLAAISDAIVRNDDELRIYKERLIELSSDLKIISALDSRPKGCNFDNCVFISEAIRLVKDKYKSIEEFMQLQSDVNQAISNLTDESMKMREQKQRIENDLNNCILLDEIMKRISSNYQILEKLAITERILDKNQFIELIVQGSRFNFLRNLNRYYDLANNIIEYRSIKNILSKLESEYIIQKNNADTIQEYEAELALKNTQLDEIRDKCNLLKKDSIFISDLITSFKQKKERFERLKELNEMYITSLSFNEQCEREYNDMKSKFQSCSDIILKLTDMNQMIKDNMELLVPIKQQKKDIDVQLTMLDTYQQEYGMYKEKYDVIDKLKRYSSPTAGGIQTLFMSIYMSKTLDLANQLLSMIFAGQYRLLDYVITDTEFRMPFVGNGLAVDDISSGSTSQVCIMGMIINLVLRNQASTKYNITSLDEIDGGLDHTNRYLFVDILQKIIDILRIEQLFIISHSVESALNNVDVIQLSSSQEYVDLFSNANIIYQYNL